jgi:arylsulfatase A
MVKKPFRQGLLIGPLVLLLLGIGGAYHTVAQRIAAPRPPNFIILLGEGQGWNSTSVQMDDTVHTSKSSFIQTPNLERLAREGMRFANAYAASPRCTPSRAALLTGKTPALLRMTFIAVRDADNSRRLIEPSPVLELPESEMTIAELLKGAGYATAHFGKWHVGRANPTRHGFDENDGANGSGGPNTTNPKQVYLTTELGIDFVSRQTKAGKPFLLQISQHGGGSVEDARPETVAAIRQRGVNDLQLADAAIAEDVDINIGLLLKKLDELGIADNTYVIYTTDHGGYGRINAPLNNGKGSLLEGGIRVPLIIRGPGVKAGVCSHTRVAGIDLLPTIAELARLKTSLPKSIEGGSLAPALRSSSKAAVKRPREELIFHFPHYDYENDGPASVIFLGHLKAYKRYETGELRLYDLAKDLGEQHDLAKQMPAQAAAMERRMNEYLKAVNAQMATVNPNYDARKARK